MVGFLRAARVWRSGFRVGDGRRGRCAQAGDVLQGRRADLPGEVPGVPSAELDRADVAHHLQEARPWARVDQGARRARARCRRGTSTRASACRSSRTTCRSPTSRSTRSSRWVDARRAAGRSEGHAAAEAARHRQRVAGRAATASVRPTSSIKSSEYTMPAQHQDVWYRPMSDIPLTEPRWVEDGRDSSDQPEGAARSCTTRSPISC